MSRFGTFKVDGRTGRVVQITEAKRYEPKDLVKSAPHVRAVVVPRVRESERPKLYTGLYL